MIHGYNSFQVEIKNLKYRSQGQVFPKTAIISFEVEGRTKPIVELLGYMDENDIYQLIDEGKAIELDHCYISRFSLDNYRRVRQLDRKQRITIKGFSAKDAFFDSSMPFDFSFADFDSGNFDINSAWFHRGEINFESAKFACESINFHDVKFADSDFLFKNVKIESANVDFKNARFGVGTRDFQYSSFGTGDLSFANAEFLDGDVSFINADFGGGDISFKVARFGQGRVDFHFAKFNNRNISFERTEFGNGRTDFRTVEFGNARVNFNRSTFGDGEVTFEASEMESGKFSFKRAEFGNGSLSFEEAVFSGIDVSFERTHFGKGNISFYKSTFGALSFRFCHLDDYIDLRVSHCSSVDLSNTIVRDIIDLNPYEFDLDVTTIRFAGMRMIGRVYIDWKRNNVKAMIHSQEECPHRVLSEQFRILKENFSSCGQYEDEDRAYVEFKRHEAKADLIESIGKKKINALWSYPFYWFKDLLFDKAGLYATSPIRVLITMVTVFIIFSFVYVLMIAGGNADIIASVNDNLTVFARSFYHSAITFLTIGYGDHFPFGAIRWVSSLEGFAGLFLMSYFTVAFVRKVLR